MTPDSWSSQDTAVTSERFVHHPRLPATRPPAHRPPALPSPPSAHAQPTRRRRRISRTLRPPTSAIAPALALRLFTGGGVSTVVAWAEIRAGAGGDLNLLCPRLFAPPLPGVSKVTRRSARASGLLIQGPFPRKRRPVGPASLQNRGNPSLPSLARPRPASLRPHADRPSRGRGR